jgi:hypothetical protein
MAAAQASGVIGIASPSPENAMTKLARALSLSLVAGLAACGKEAPPAPPPEVHLLPHADVLSIDLDFPTAPRAR